MRRIEEYFKPIPKKIQRRCGNIQDKKANGRSSLNKLEIYTAEDDSDSAIELKGNVFNRDHVRVETHDSVVDELNSVEIESLKEDCITLSDKKKNVHYYTNTVGGIGHRHLRNKREFVRLSCNTNH